MNLEDIMKNMPITQRQILHESAYMKCLKHLNSVKKMVLSGAGEEKNGEMLINEHKISLIQDE